jgi:DNA invertase Pin-like site-specific DNA recombinase
MMTSQGERKRAILYARYSTEHQNERSIADQLRECRAFAASHGWTVIDCYSDAAVSGVYNARTEYKQLVRAIESGHADVVVAESLNRLTRDQEEAPGLYKRCKFHDVELWTVSEGLIDAMRVGLQSTLSAMFLKEQEEKTRRGLQG